MIDLGLAPDVRAIAALVIVALMFVVFALEWFETEVVAMVGAAVMLLFGFLPYKDAAENLANNAPWTIAFMFLIMGGLVRTGALNELTKVIERHAASKPKRTIVALFVFVVFASAIMNNTPVVAVMIPIVIQIARRLGVSPSKLLMPLSYFTVLGGMITLIGTSTNLLVDGVAKDRGLAHFSIFEIAPLGLAVAAVGAIYMALFADKLLPARVSMAEMLIGRRSMKYFTEVAVPEDSALIGTPVLEVPLFKREGIRVIDVLRGDASLRRDLPSAVLAPGDRIVLRTEMTDLLDLQQRRDVHMVDKLSSVATETVEVLISPGCRMIGRTLGELRLRRRYGVYVLAAHRRNQNIGRKLDDLEVRVGDTLLLEGSAEDIGRLAQDMDLVNVSKPAERPFRRGHAPIAILALLAVVGLSALDVAPIMALAFVAVGVILVTRCIDADEAFSFVDGRLMALIFAMLAVGEGLEQSGSVDLIVRLIAPHLDGLSPFLTILCVYFLGVVMTEILSNNAVAVILTPIGIQLANELGKDPRPFVVAVMFSATLAFATPIGYQTNTMVYGPGGYKFTDYVRLGLPLNIICGLVACALIPILWPL
ncbi:SLC13 family permease [Frigidibacter sp. MR17.14]|uniref:SLC13 family permease n=1 Tax=Frigidibacter sp. MR17.14 TaxID=3126509 RepID=UPI003012AFCC